VQGFGTAESGSRIRMMRLTVFFFITATNVGLFCLPPLVSPIILYFCVNTNSLKMKLKIIIASLLFAMAFIPKTSNAQFSLSSLGNAFSSTGTYNSLLNSMTSLIKPGSFSDSWQSIKTTWSAKLRSAKDIATYKTLLTDLVSNIKTSSFKPTWLTDKAGWLTKLQSATKLADIASLTSKLESSLNASAFSSSFASAKGYLDKGLSYIK